MADKTWYIKIVRLW